MSQFFTHPGSTVLEHRFTQGSHDEVETLNIELADSAAAIGRPHGAYYSILKPAMDRLIASAMILILLPIMAIVWVIIGLTTGADPIFRQVRIGQGGQPFSVYKFCTMKPDRRQTVVEVKHDRRQTHKSANDPRVTAVGRFLRKWSLDELPQLFNVLNGDMSLVGPRPEIDSIVEHYEPWQHARHLVKPGLTGLWQISDRGHKPLHECTQVDIDYVKSLSLRVDVQILLGTPLAAFGANRGF